MNEIEQAREAIAKALIAFELHPYPRDIDRKEDEGISEFLHKAALILSLKGPGWRLAVVREKGELPRVEQPTRNYTDVNFGYQLAQQDMLDEGWVQGVK